MTVNVSISADLYVSTCADRSICAISNFMSVSGLSGYNQARFLIKIESQDQQVLYTHQMAAIKGCEMYIKFPSAPYDILFAMKLSALISRQKCPDFYNVMYLMPQTEPNSNFLNQN
jgi:hypothetical protein